ncbi:14127_t:CDS:10 [Acaulospora morrowiae]|uniref:14127_t:CDS:1 n=1 Tax=Acaulospora morrowiae TaxID=94023 RepID=A0A9N9AEV9_9GLOM|nr:14127_t:CDS:10 [Acaulospora morrowiae]
MAKLRHAKSTVMNAKFVPISTVGIWSSRDTLSRPVMNAKFVPILTAFGGSWDTLNDNMIQEHVNERNTLVEEQHNEILKNAIVRDQVVRTTLTKHLSEYSTDHREERPRKRLNKENPAFDDKSKLDPDDTEDLYNIETLDIDPNITFTESELYEQIPFQKHLKYPNKDSQKDIWLLPSGKSIKEVIRGPENLHKSHPSYLGIIRVGARVRKPEWIEKNDWNYLQASIEYPNYNLSSDVENLITALLETNSLTEYKQCLRKAKFDEIDKEMEFVTDVLMWFMNKNEAILGSLMIHPVLQYLTNAVTSRPVYVPGEICLKASANQRLLRRNLKPTDDKPLGMKVDGFFQSPGDKGPELGMIELSGGYLTFDMPRYLKDHVKGYWGTRDLLNDIFTKFNRGDYEIMRHLRTWFLHVHGLNVQVWGMDLPVSKTYRMFLIGTFRLPISWEDHHELVHALRILWNLGMGLDDTIKVLEDLRKSHRRNSALRSQTSALKNYMGDVKNTPEKPKGKNSRIINPLVYDDYDDHLHHHHQDTFINNFKMGACYKCEKTIKI